MFRTVKDPDRYNKIKASKQLVGDPVKLKRLYKATNYL